MQPQQTPTGTPFSLAPSDPGMVWLHQLSPKTTPLSLNKPFPLTPYSPLDIDTPPSTQPPVKTPQGDVLEDYLSKIQELVVNSVARSLFLVVSNLGIVHEMRNCQFAHCHAMFTPCLRIVHAVNPYAVAHASIMQPVMRKLCGKYAQTVREVCANCEGSMRS